MSEKRSGKALRTALTAVYGADGRSRGANQTLPDRPGTVPRTLLALGPVVIFRAPGRVNLIGEHTDYNHGYVLPMALDRDVLVLARPRGGRNGASGQRRGRFPRATVPDQRANPPPTAPATGSTISKAQPSFLAREQRADLVGFDGLIDSALPYGVPRGAGLSSSSALTVTAAATLIGLNTLPLVGPELAEACGRAEWYVGTRGGIMDQFSSVLSKQGHALFLDCRPAPDGSYRYRHVPIPSGYDVVVVDSRVRHRNTGPHFNRRVAEDRIGVRLLQSRWPQITHLRDVDSAPWAKIEPLLPEVIHTPELLTQGIDPETILEAGVSPQTDTFYVRRRCRHVLSENQRVLASIEALGVDDIDRFGRLMAEAHDSAPR